MIGTFKFDLIATKAHIHSPSEHLINGKSYPYEVHLVHKLANFPFYVAVSRLVDIVKNAGGDTEVTVNGLNTEKPTNSFLKMLDDSLTMLNKGNEPVTLGKTVKLSEIVSTKHGGYYSYQGSFTTGDYTENVYWVVLDEPLVHDIELPRLDSSRLCIQEINSRTVDHYMYEDNAI